MPTAGPARQEPDEEPEFVGVVTARRSEVIPASFTGRITKVHVRASERVSKGRPIATLDDKEIKSQIDGHRAEERSAYAQAGVGGAQAAYAAQRMKAQQRLVDRQAAAPMTVDQARSEFAVGAASSGAAAAQGGVAKARREVLERKLANAEMKSPIDGVVMQVKAIDGQVIQEGNPVARVFDTSDLMIRFALPKHLREKVTVGDRVRLTIENADAPLWATVEHVSAEEPQINFVIVEADIDDSKLRPDEVRVASVGKVRLEKKRVVATANTKGKKS
ncbi:MAG: HlyD family efflux transporter periplasmic adaptor subunit [Deltaproteobacteria bacterium]|nr:HlyD family efflux transporter periplasmic adaptor subunit [Deltaproteobacteria bacterium]MCW5801083.1 HlyD family efflux transporter periplasmic adaptor subunit [Deltaproteobacteria bacterium]